MDLETILKKYFGLENDLNSNEGEEAYEKMISFLYDLGQITDKFNPNAVITDLDSI